MAGWKLNGEERRREERRGEEAKGIGSHAHTQEEMQRSGEETKPGSVTAAAP